jgi:hypothetical protein
MTENEKETSKATLALAWLAVGIPLIWGVVETLQKAMKLFVHA